MSTTATLTKTQLLIGGQWRDASDSSVYEDSNPATGAKIADVADAPQSRLQNAMDIGERFIAGDFQDCLI